MASFDFDFNIDTTKVNKSIDNVSNKAADFFKKIEKGEIKVDSKEAEKALDDLVEASEKVTESFTQIGEITLPTIEVEKLGNSFSEVQKEANKSIDAQKRALAQLIRSGKEGTDEYQRLERQLKENVKEVRELDNALDKIERSIEVEVDVDTDEAQRNIGSLSNIAQIAAGVGIAELATEAATAAIGAAVEKFSALNEIQRETAQLTGATGDELNRLTSEISATASTFDQDYNEVLRSSNSLAQSFGIEMTDSINTIQKGFLAGADIGGDLLSNIEEYAPQLQRAGLELEEVIALGKAGLEQGVFSDKAFDTVKEFNLRIKEQTEATRTALEQAFGTDFTNDIFEGIKDGSVTTVEAFKEISEQFETLDNQSKQVVLADVFGGAGEDAVQFVESFKDVSLELDDYIDKTDSATQAQAELLDANTRLDRAFTELFDGTEGGFDSIMAIGKNLIADVLEKMTPTIQKIMEGFKNFWYVTEPIWKGLWDVIVAVQGAIFKLFNPLSQLETMGESNQETLDKMRKGFEQAAEGIAQVVSAISQVTEWIGKARQAVTDFFLGTETGKKAPLRKPAEETKKDSEEIANNYAKIEKAITVFADRNEKAQFDNSAKFETAKKSIEGNIDKLLEFGKITEEQARTLSDKLKGIDYNNPSIAPATESLKDLKDRLIELTIAGKDQTDEYDRTLQKVIELTKAEKERTKTAKDLDKLIKSILSDEKILPLEVETSGIIEDTKKAFDNIRKQQEQILSEKVLIQVDFSTDDPTSKKSLLNDIKSIADEFSKSFDSLELTGLKKSQEEIREMIEETEKLFDDRTDTLADQLANDEISWQEYADKIKDIEKEKSEAISDIRKEELKSLDEYAAKYAETFSAIGQSVSESITFIKDYAEIQEKSITDSLELSENVASSMKGIFEEQSAAYKAFAITEASIATYLAAAKAVSELGPIVGPIMAAVITASGLARVAKIASFEKGGEIQGGEQLIRVNEKGQEFIVNAQATAKNKPLLEMMNKGIDIDKNINHKTKNTANIDLRVTNQHLNNIEKRMRRQNDLTTNQKLEFIDRREIVVKNNNAKIKKVSAWR